MASSDTRSIETGDLVVIDVIDGKEVTGVVVDLLDVDARIAWTDDRGAVRKVRRRKDRLFPCKKDPTDV